MFSWRSVPMMYFSKLCVLTHICMTNTYKIILYWFIVTVHHATLTGAYSVHLKWSEPGQPNGLISHYRLVYRKHQKDPTLNSTIVTALTVEVISHTHTHVHVTCHSYNKCKEIWTVPVVLVPSVCQWGAWKDINTRCPWSAIPKITSIILYHAGWSNISEIPVWACFLIPNTQTHTHIQTPSFPYICILYINSCHLLSMWTGSSALAGIP